MKKLAVFLLAVLAISSAAQAASFSGAQSVDVIGLNGNGDDEWTGTYIVDLYAYTQIFTGQMYGNYTANYQLNYGRWYDICIYNYSLGGFEELIYLLNLELT